MKNKKQIESKNKISETEYLLSIPGMKERFEEAKKQGDSTSTEFEWGDK
jgi:hypothetical protein